MTYPKPTGLLIAILFVSMLQAQNTTTVKPKLFAAFPYQVTCTVQELSKVFSIAADQPVKLSFSDHFLFSGVVTSNLVKYSNLQTVIMQSPEMDNVIFTISKIINAGGSITYTGHVIHKAYADGYELKKDDQNQYRLVKFETDKLLQDCNTQ